MLGMSWCGSVFYRLCMGLFFCFLVEAIVDEGYD